MIAQAPFCRMRFVCNDPKLRTRLDAWERYEYETDRRAEMANTATGIVITTNSSIQESRVGIGGSAQDTLFNRTREAVLKYAVAISTAL
jgi:hypothetical protein